MAMVIYFAICFGKITFTTLNAYGSFMSLTTIVSAFRRQTVLSQKCRIAFVVLMVTASCMQEAVTISTTNAMRHFCDSTVCRRKAETMVVSDIKLPYALRVVKVILPKQMAK